MDSYLEFDFDVTHRADAHARCVGKDHIRLVNLGPMALFNKNRLTSSGGKELEETGNAHVICSLYKLISSSRDSEDLSKGFHKRLKFEKENSPKIKQLKVFIL